MSKWIKFILLTFSLVSSLLWTNSAMAVTNYRAEEVPTVPNGDTVKMGRVVITGTTTITFTGEDRAEFRLPSGFYITDAGLYGEGNFDVELRVIKGFTDSSPVTIRPIAEDPYTPGRYNGFEIMVNKPSGGEGNEPELILYFNNVYVPQGYTGSVQLKVEKGDLSGFSDQTINIASVQSSQLTITTEKTPSLSQDSQDGPTILVKENMSNTFDNIELSLPSGFYWQEDTIRLDPGLGMVYDYDGDGNKERDYTIDVYNNKYGRSVLNIELTGEKSDTSGTLRINSNVSVDEDLATYGDINVLISADADPNINTLKIGSFNEQTAVVTADSPKTLYSGLTDQLIANITIKENAPGALINGGRVIRIDLPDDVEWYEPPLVELQGDTELTLGLDNELAFLEDNSLRLYVNSKSINKPATILIKEPRINIPADFSGELKVTVAGSARAAGEVTVGTIKSPLVATSPTKPALQAGLRGQAAGDIIITEPAGQILLAKKLWVDFPSYVHIKETPTVQVTTGDLKIKEDDVELITTTNGYRLIIPIEVSSITASTLKISGIIYDTESTAPYGDVKVEIGGPAVNELDEDTLSRVANASIVELEEPVETTPTHPVNLNVEFKLGQKTYKVNGATRQMDIAPYSKDGRTYLPLRYVGSALGIDQDVTWDKETKTATLTKDGTSVTAKIGEKAIYRGEEKIETDAAAQLQDGRVMVPLRAVAKAFGAEVTWVPETKTVVITSQLNSIF